MMMKNKLVDIIYQRLVATIKVVKLLSRCLAVGNKKILLFQIMILERLNKFICKLLPKKKAVDPYYECYPNHLPRLMKELEDDEL